MEDQAGFDDKLRGCCRLLASSVLVLAVTAGAVRTAYPSLVVPMNLRTLMKESDEVFAGTVRKIEFEEQPEAGLVTHVSLANLAVVKSKRPRTEVTLTVAGGRIGNSESFVMDLPRFEIGSRYVVFADSHLGSEKDSYIPFVGLYQGIWFIGHKGRGSEVSDSEGRAVLGVVRGRAVVLADPPAPATRVDKPQLMKPPKPEEQRSRRRPDVPVGGYVASIEEYVPPDTLPATALPEEARALGVTSAEEGVYVVPRNRDPKTRMTEAEFLNAIRKLGQESD